MVKEVASTLASHSGDPGSDLGPKIGILSDGLGNGELGFDSVPALYPSYGY
jgi:hypothetical protein